MEFILRKEEMLDLGQALDGLEIICHSGKCWLTQAGDGRDHILRKGDSFTVQTGGKVILTAYEECQVGMTNSKRADKKNSEQRVLFRLARGCALSSI